VIERSWTQWLGTLTQNDEIPVAEVHRGEHDKRHSQSSIGDRIEQKIEQLELGQRIELIRRLSEDPRDDVRLTLAAKLTAGAWEWIPLDLRLGLFEALGASQSSEVRRLVAKGLGNWVDPSTKLAAMAVLMGMRRADDARFEDADEGLRAVDEALFKLSGHTHG
jgi:hypothetical protein